MGSTGRFFHRARARTAAVVISCAMLVAGAHAAVERSLTLLRQPPGVLAADAGYDAQGTLHMVLARETGCTYTSRSADGHGFASERALPGSERPQVGGERRPHILIGTGGRLFALWQTEAGIQAATSADHGHSWTAISTDALTSRTGVDVFNSALGADGTLYLVWAAERDEKLPDDSVAQHLYLASTTDAGKVFTTPRAITTDGARACPCCVPAIATGAPGELWIAYRSSRANTKEIHLLASRDSGRTFLVQQLSDHKWMMDGCPMAGPSIGVAGSRLVLSWTSRGDMFTAASVDSGRTFSKPERLGRGRFNQVAVSPAGQILQVWDEGDKTGLWWRDDPHPAERVSLTPKGALVAAPNGRFELLQSTGERLQQAR